MRERLLTTQKDMTPRRVGLAITQRPQPLLNRVNNKERIKLQQKVADDAEPMSSADEEEETPTISRETQSLRRDADPATSGSSDSESGQVSRGTIKRTAFGASENKPRDRGTRNLRPTYRKASSDDDTEDSGAKRRKLDDEKAALKKPKPAVSFSSSAEHLTNEHGFTKKPSVKSKYGAKYGSSQESQTKKVSYGQKAKLKAPDSLDSPKKSAKAKFRAPSDPLLESPSKGLPKFIKHSQEKDDSDDTGSSLPVRNRVIRQTAPQGSKRKNRGNIWKESKPPPEKRAKFLIPADLPDFSFSQESQGTDDQSKSPSKSPLPPLSDFSDLSDLSDLDEPSGSQSAAEGVKVGDGDDDKPKKATTTTCPWCGDIVSETLLKEFSKGRRLDVRLQTRFCKKHKRQTAMDTWHERKYPTDIPWSDLHSRFEDHREYLLKVVRGEPSHFRSILAEKIETGKARNLKKEDNLNPGYYGPRGFNLMCDYLVGEFGDLLKEKAVADRVIAGRGSAAFIESVLVAELAVRLIQEDMDVSVTEARTILEESKAVGEMIHEDV